jgi:hypothetical protein
MMGHLAASSPLTLRAEEPGPIIQPYPPVAPASPATTVAATTAPDPLPAATLERPVAIRAGGAMVDTEVQPTGLLFNRRNPDSAPAGSFSTAQPVPSAGGSTLPMPSQSATTPPTDVPYTWRQPPAPDTVAPPDPSATTILPSPNGPLVPAPAPEAGPTEIGGPLPGGSCGAGDCSAGGCGMPGCGMPGCCTMPGCCGVEGCEGCGCGWNDCCGCGHGCCFGNRWYGSAEYLLWFIRGQPLPPLLTTGPITDNPPGAIGQPGTQVLFGGGNLNNNPFSGARLRLGYWFNDCHGLGMEIGGFFLGGGTSNFSQTSLGVPFLGRPFFNALTNAQDVEAVASPNGLTGTFNASNPFILYGAEANLRRNLFCGCNWYFDAIAGWRLLGLNEALNIHENLAVAASTNPNLPAGSTFLVSDRFGTTNLFNGGQIGGIFEYRLGRWSVDLRTSVALGGTQQNVSISGSTLSQAPGQQGTLATGGLLAQTSNIGHFSRDIVTVVPEVGINLGYQFTNHIRAFVGYNFLYWSNVVRPGNQVDQAVNPNLIPPSIPGGPQRPTFDFHGSDFWAQGVNFGLDIRW